MPLLDEPGTKLPDKDKVDAATYNKALHQFFMGAARCSVSHAPIMRVLMLADVKEKRSQLRAHIEQLHNHPDAALSEKDRAKLKGAGIHGAKRIPSQKEFARMLAMLDDAAAAEADVFKPEIIWPQPKNIEAVVEAIEEAMDGR
jgi:hypothetical protein